MSDNLTITEFDGSLQTIKKLEEFFLVAKEHGYSNNSSFESLKIERLSPPNGNLWLTYFENNIVGIHGVQQLSKYNKKYFRLLSRGCLLPIANSIFNDEKSLSKNFVLRSFSFYHLIPIQLNWLYKTQINFKPVLTVNAPKEKDDAGKSFSFYKRVFPFLEKQKILTLIEKDAKINGCIQDVYELNTCEFFKKRKKEM